MKTEDDAEETLYNTIAKAIGQAVRDRVRTSHIAGILESTKSALFEMQAQRCRAIQAKELISRAKKSK
jgi:hypothetical protein